MSNRPTSREIIKVVSGSFINTNKKGKKNKDNEKNKAKNSKIFKRIKERKNFKKKIFISATKTIYKNNKTTENKSSLKGGREKFSKKSLFAIERKERERKYKNAII